MPDDQTQEPCGAVVTTDFVRHRNVMLVQADTGPLLVDYFLHQADHRLRPEPAHDALLRQALAVFTLHCAARPRNEHLAWTVGLQEPRLNLFLAGDNEDCTVTGRLFTENVREAPANVFYSEVMPGRGAEKRRSVVNFEGTDLVRAAETFYATSEQRPARFFDRGDDRHALLLALPDCDEAWLRSVDLAGLNALAGTETLTRIEHRLYRWNCGCNQRKILAALAPVARGGLDGLFGEEEVIQVQCPRCAAGYAITREAMEAWLAGPASV
ncbi:Hsp33-like chaperonin [Lacunisphaera limnophila]|uniref:Hsp33-like chaperonin n=1 Tax=Lacunisphaera limnophila TaxID=1838286 RepID=A0A1D8ARE6_9BACT|nr:Hsp33 family molecular chaperone HslO [Lacunisphaera limnophila]AOS43464.1 Hsp33-like chaperonin [Lacunisphaera limnophila]